MTTGSLKIEVGCITKMAESLWLAERTPNFGAQTQHCTSYPNAMAFLSAACSIDLSADRVSNVGLEQYTVGYWHIPPVVT